jgi:hypothetical protein
MKRLPLVNLKSYDLTITQSWETDHGVSGHLFEIIEYFYHFKFHKNINVCILLADGITLNQLITALSKYSFTKAEHSSIIKHCKFAYQPKVVLANDIIFVDGSLRTLGADILCKRKMLLRCAEDEYLEECDLVLQDYDVYDPLDNSIDYKKKILFSKFKEIDESSDAIMFYGTSNARMLSYDDLEVLTSKYKAYKYILLTNEVFDVPSNIELMIVPVERLWETFSTYVYTKVLSTTHIDCSPRFIAECKFYNKEVIYDTETFDKGLEVRMRDLNNMKTITLDVSDEITKVASII